MFESALKMLRVEGDADMETIRQAYIRMVKRYPPEHSPGKFAAVRHAYLQLCLDDSVLVDLAEKAMQPGSAKELTTLLWGDLHDTTSGERGKGIGFTELGGLLDAPERKRELLAALAAAESDGVVLKGEANGHE